MQFIASLTFSAAVIIQTKTMTGRPYSHGSKNFAFSFDATNFCIKYEILSYTHNFIVNFQV